jgi:phosphoglycolate phosphatase
MPIKLIIFDLDGTLVDTSRDITNALNYALKPYGLKDLTVDDTIKMVGEGITRLIEKILGNGKSQMEDEVIKRFLEYYSEHLVDYSSIYPYVRETLEKLDGFKKAVISNKREYLSTNLLEKLDLLKYFNLIVGSDTVAERKPSPVPVIYVFTRLGVTPYESIIVGDSNYDIEAGRKAGVKTVAVTYGYRERQYLMNADYMIDSMVDLLSLL